MRTARSPEGSPVGTHFTLELVGVQQVDEDLQPPHVSDGQLTRLLRQVTVPHGAQGDHCGCLITSLCTHTHTHHIHTHSTELINTV